VPSDAADAYSAPRATLRRDTPSEERGASDLARANAWCAFADAFEVFLLALLHPFSRVPARPSACTECEPAHSRSNGFEFSLTLAVEEFLAPFASSAQDAASSVCLDSKRFATVTRFGGRASCAPDFVFMAARYAW